jgi:flagellar motor switch protein FliN/FliY
MNGDRLVVVGVDFTEGVIGDAALVFTDAEATSIAELMLVGMDHTEDDLLGELGLSALGEAMNQFVAGIGRELGESKGCLVNISPPRVNVITAGEKDVASPDPDLVVGWEGTIGSTTGRLYWTMSSEVVKTLGVDPADTPTSPPPPPATPTDTPQPTAGNTAADLGRLAEVMLDVSVELGRSSIPIRELLSLDEGGVIRLGRPVGEPVDLLVNGLPTARGEIVVVDGRLGLKVTELIS